MPSVGGNISHPLTFRQGDYSIVVIHPSRASCFFVYARDKFLIHLQHELRYEVDEQARCWSCHVEPPLNVREQNPDAEWWNEPDYKVNNTEIMIASQEEGSTF